MITVPFLSLQAVHAPYQLELEEAAARCLASGNFILGEQVASFEQEWAGYCGVPHAIGVGNGLDALVLSLRALQTEGRLSPGDEILVPAYTFYATHLAILSVGCTPILVEPNLHTYCMDFADLQAKITPKCRGLIAVHLHGFPEEISQIQAIADTHGLWLMEDAAQAHGARCGTAKAGGLSEMGAFSFYPTKNLGALGDGGAIITHRSDLATMLHEARNYGYTSCKQVQRLGLNSRLDEVQAAVLRVKLRYLDEQNQQRAQIAEQYQLGINHPKVKLPALPSKGTHVWHHFVVVTPHRSALQQHLADRGIETAIHYPRPSHLEPIWPQTENLPKTEMLVSQVLSLPLYPGMRPEQITAVIEAINTFPP